MKIKFVTVIATAAALLAGQALAQQPAAAKAPAKAVVATAKQAAPVGSVKRVAAPMGRTNAQSGEEIPLELLLFAGTGVVLGAIVYNEVNNDDDPKSP